LGPPGAHYPWVPGGDKFIRLRIGTLNCKGLAGEKKRQDFFNWLRQKKTKNKIKIKNNLIYIVYRKRIFKIEKENK